ncbi:MULTISPECIES: Sir2 family NAD-dependent protein deacetylase [unclassified Nocardioides]|jgi:NAD-dependent SIR2 family protein deacetylase|uniref:Sir2 family NAD-dependent protein deacetylase n=1 Tax=unclassified Nocardioides TaxID=2615069 RepID=UPI000702B432|nr:MULTISPECIES: Sir2 family NAD-dependent protein deacetylase [unclassified Nocardioides]KRC53847.1 NAD-dependent deacetylase [Nocardioides sp. Root79]KRC71183.1 NAD-dependent deacetylase [Nocardioides sp. Root240]
MTLVDTTDPALARCATGPLVVLTGAGLSTDSGIPDYRGPGAPARMPMTYQEFVSGPAAQQRYWARSHLGWSRMRRADPNAGHRAVAVLGADLVITQNVDGLHEAAGTPHTVALHGRISDVVCLGCRRTTARAALQQRLEEANPGWAAAHADVAVRPDGDVDLEDTAGFVVPACEDCGGALKPDVVFFGENVPKPRVERCYAAVDALAGTGGSLLVAGSSLTVMSGLRFVRRAAHRGTPVVIVNRGTTRGDELATHKVDAGTSEWLTALAGLRAS